MLRVLAVACVLFVACDQRVDELLAAGVQLALEEPPRKPTGHAADCAKGKAEWIAPGTLRAIECRPMKRDASVEWSTR